MGDEAVFRRGAIPELCSEFIASSWKLDEYISADERLAMLLTVGTKPGVAPPPCTFMLARLEELPLPDKLLPGPVPLKLGFPSRKLENRIPAPEQSNT